MRPFPEPFKIESHQGQPVHRGDVTVIPISKSLTVQLPFLGFVWNRPVAILIEEGETSQELPIIDVTFLAQLTFAPISLAAAVLALVFSRAGKQ